MTPTHARKRGIKYRYYVSSTLLEGQPERSGSIRRVPAIEIETLVIRSMREHLKPKEPTDEKALVNNHVERVDVQPDHLVIQIFSNTNSKPSEGERQEDPPCPLAQNRIYASS
jgi:site-specific DNA recombinase